MKKAIKFFLILLIFSVHLSEPVFSGEARVRISAVHNTFSGIDDIQAEILFGRELAARILGNHPLVDDADIQTYVNLVGRAVALYSGRPELRFYFGVLDSGEINAYAAPGGYIFVTRGALLAMEDEAQLAAVLGHEIAHVVEKHVIEELNVRSRNGSAAAGLASFIGGSTGSVKGALEQALDEAADILFARGYKVADEIEADRAGLLMAAVAGYDPSALERFLTRVDGFEKQEKTHEGGHPVHEVRMEKIREAMKAHDLAHAPQKKVEERFYANIKD